MAVVQDGAATAARAGKPLCAAAVSVSAVCTDLRWLNCAMVQAVGESPVGSARGSPKVEHHPVRDSVTAVARVVRAVEATPEFCGELSLLIGITGRKVSPCGRGDETGEADGFGIDRRTAVTDQHCSPRVRTPVATRNLNPDVARSVAT